MVLVIILKFAGIPITFKRRGNLINGLRQVLLRNLYVPFKAAGNRCIGEVRGAHIGRGKAGVAVEHIGFCVQAGAFGIIADLDECIGQLAQFFNGFYVGGTHVGCCNNAQLSAILGEGGQLIHNQTQAAPFDKRHQHVNAIA